MKRIVLVIAVFAGSAAINGCLNPHYTQFPTIMPKNSQIEKRAAEVHDPFPNVEAGPETNHRPVGYGTPRTKPRRDLEHRQRRLIRPRSGESELPPSVPVTRKYTNVVRP
jgi:hypothetical protein